MKTITEKLGDILGTDAVTNIIFQYYNPELCLHKNGVVMVREFCGEDEWAHLVDTQYVQADPNLECITDHTYLSVFVVHEAACETCGFYHSDQRRDKSECIHYSTCVTHTTLKGGR